MNSKQTTVLFLLLLNISIHSFGQGKLVKYELKKGEAFDILLATTKAGSKDSFKEYREKAFPVAVEMGYSFLPGFNISEIVQGKTQPKGIIMGKWTSLATREKFLDVIEERVPNFHQLRKDIWSLFNVTYYEIKEDYFFELDPSKIIVATACWKKENTQSQFDSFINKWKNALKKTDGTIKLELTNGKSPSGYVYNPDIMVIAQWDSLEDFEAFQKLNLKMDFNILKNVNQFVLEK